MPKGRTELVEEHRKARRTLIRGGTVVPMDPRYPEEFVADVLIDGSRIVELAPSIIVDGSTQIVDARGRIVIPGLVDTHRHLWQSVLRQVGVDWTIAQYANVAFGVFGPLFTPHDMYVSVLIGLLEALDAGITQVFDWDHNLNTPEHADEVVRAHAEAGARVILGYGQGSAQWRQTYAEDSLGSAGTPSRDIERLLARSDQSDRSLRRVALAARGPEKVPLPVAAMEWKQARALGIRISVHVGNGLRARERPIAKLRAEGLLGPDTTYVHCSSLADDEIELIAASGGAASCAPEIEASMGHGRPALSRLIAAGVQPSLSVDTCTNVGGDLFAVMRAALAQMRENEHAAAHTRGVTLSRLTSTAYDALAMATRAGASANGLSHVTGSITPGKEADIAVLRADAPNMFPLSYAVGAVVKSAHAGNVETVFVAGRAVKKDGRLVAVDLESLRRTAERCRDDLISRAGVTLEQVRQGDRSITAERA